jgi:hypothetical protein
MYEHKIKVTTQSSFTEAQIAVWLDEVGTKGWELVSMTFFGQGVLWAFRRTIIEGRPEDPESIDENAPT